MMKITMMFFLLIPLVISNVYAFDQIPITLSAKMNDVIFDGKWSFPTEWKQSSLNEYSYDNSQTAIILRTAHQDNFVYVFIDAITDITIDKEADKAMICFDTNNDKTAIPDQNDYCFLSTLESKSQIAYQGDPTARDYFREIPVPQGYRGISATSDKNDRYSSVSHTSYEFRIPTDTIGRKSIYGFYFSVYDASTKEIYTYPTNTTAVQMFTSPENWGEVYSPDKSLPEFGMPMFALLPAFGLVFYFTRLFRI